MHCVPEQAEIYPMATCNWIISLQDTNRFIVFQILRDEHLSHEKKNTFALKATDGQLDLRLEKKNGRKQFK